MLNYLKHIILFHKEYFPWFKKSFSNFGQTSVIHHPAIITEQQNISIGNGTTILNNSRLQIYNYLTGKDSTITIGDNCYIGYRFSALAGGNIKIGNNVLIASDVLITSENHGTDPECKTPYMDQPLICQDVTIDNGCWIGEKVTILPGVTIGEKCIIGANSVVTKSLPSYTIAAGSPARIIKTYNFETHQWEKV